MPRFAYRVVDPIGPGVSGIELGDHLNNCVFQNGALEWDEPDEPGYIVRIGVAHGGRLEMEAL